MIENNIHFKIVNKKFPGIAKKIKVFWGYPEFVALVYELQHDASDRPRVGFPYDVLMALHALENEHNRLWPNLARKDSSIWNAASR